MMDPALKEMLKMNQTLLIRNMIPCEEFYLQLVLHNVFPGSMMYEIKRGATVEEKNLRILELLTVRGASVLPRFCDALQLSNHNFLAELLRDEGRSFKPKHSARPRTGRTLTSAKANKKSLMESQMSGSRPEARDIFRKFPKLDKLLSGQDKDDLLGLLSRKMKEEAIRQGWKQETGDKEKALEAKQRQLEESFRSREQLKEKDDLIENLQHQLTNAGIKFRERSLEIKHLSNYIEKIHNKDEKELETQMNYNVANEKSLSRLTEREMNVNKHLEEMIALMKTSLTNYGYRHVDDHKQAYAINNIDIAKSTLYLLLKMIDEYDLIKTKCMQLVDERRNALQVIRAGTGDLEKEVEDINLVSVIKEFATEKEDNIGQLNAQLVTITEKYDSIKDMAARSDAMRDMLNSFREDIMAKEEVITELTKENQDLKEKLVAAKKENKPKKGVTFSSPTPQIKVLSLPSPRPQKESASYSRSTPQKKAVTFPSPIPLKKSVAFRSPSPQKMSVSFPSPTPSNASGQHQGVQRVSFTKVRAATPIAKALVSESDSDDYDAESVHTEPACSPSPPELKLVAGTDKAAKVPVAAAGDNETQKQKMKVQFSLPTNHSQRVSKVLTQGMYLPPLMKQGIDFRVSGTSGGPVAVAKALNSYMKPPVKPSQDTHISFSIGGTGITNSLLHQPVTAFSGAQHAQRSKGQAKVIRVSSLASSNKNSRKSNNSSSLIHHAQYGQPYHAVPAAANSRSMNRR